MENVQYPLLFWPSDVPDIIRLLQADANRLAVWRVANRWTQAEAAVHYGVAPRTWGLWERGEYIIPGLPARAIAMEIQACLPMQN